jgi:D-arabinose 1-dehydrogenase-like Zn-dependent alcohol dehydrogenase
MAPQKIKQWLTGQDGLNKLRIEETDCPAPGEDEVLVEIHSVSLNYRDTESMITPTPATTFCESCILEIMKMYGANDVP